MPSKQASHSVIPELRSHPIGSVRGNTFPREGLKIRPPERGGGADNAPAISAPVKARNTKFGEYGGLFKNSLWYKLYDPKSILQY